MKKLMVFGLSLALFFLFIGLVSAIRINEVMAKTPESVYGANCEWVEIYSENQANLTNWIIDTYKQNKTFNYTIIDFLIITKNETIFLNNWNISEDKIIEWRDMGLSNDGDNVSLYNNSGFLVSNFSYKNSHENLSWQFCNNSWIEAMPTPGSINSCAQQPQNTTKNPPQNQSQQNNTNNNQEESIYLKLDWDEDDIVNGKEFEITVEAYNLKNENYDIKIYIKPEDEATVISETYNEEDDKWKSSTYYVENIISGSGDKSVTLSLRIKSSYRNFSGDAEVTARIRKSGTSSIIDEVKEDIEVLENEETHKNNTITQKTNETSKTTEENDKKTAQITGDVIKLGNRQAETKNEKENVLYESSSEKIKKYSIYGLNLILIVILIFLLKRKGFKTEFAKE